MTQDSRQLAADRDQQWMTYAIELSRRCPPSLTAYSVGAVVVGADGSVLATGYSREIDPHDHAEQSALTKLTGDHRLVGATVYSTLEPCSERRSGPACARLIAAAGPGRVVIAWREPPLFVADCRGVQLLTEAGLVVDELPALAGSAREVNAHLLG